MVPTFFSLDKTLKVMFQISLGTPFLGNYCLRIVQGLVPLGLGSIRTCRGFSLVSKQPTNGTR